MCDSSGEGHQSTHTPPRPSHVTNANMIVNAQQGCKGELGQGAQKISDCVWVQFKKKKKKKDG